MILSLVGTDVACILVPPHPCALRCLSFVCGISGYAGSSTAWEMFLGLNRSKHGSLENLQQAQEFVVVSCRRPEVRDPLRLGIFSCLAGIRSLVAP